MLHDLDCMHELAVVSHVTLLVCDDEDVTGLLCCCCNDDFG